MVMDIIQVRLAPKVIETIDLMIDTGLYSSRSDVVRDAVRRLVLESMSGIIKDNKNPVKEVKKIRKKLSKEKFDLEEINKLIK